MENFKIIKGFRNERDIDRLKVKFDTLSSWKDCNSVLIENNLKGIVVQSESHDKKHSVDFSFLKELSFLEYFEWLVPLTQKSDISLLFTLKKLKYLRWLPNNIFELDFSKLTSIETLFTSDYGRMENWNSLTNLKVLSISKLQKENCGFISNLKELTDLKLSRTNIASIEGLECCNKMERLELTYCPQIKELTSVLRNNPNIISVSIRKCKSINRNEIENIEKLGISVWVE